MSQGNYSNLPIGWRSVPLKHAVQLNPEVLPDSTPPETVLSYVDIAALENGVAELAPTEVSFESAPSRARRVLRSGDTILSTVRTYLKAVASFPAVNTNLIASTGFAVLRPNGQLSPRFAYWAALAEPFIENVVANSDGVSYPAINPTLLGTLPLAVPPPNDQERIANFLDDKTARIDALIAEKERLIESLAEYEQASITTAVTKGVNTKTKFLQANADWLGEVPAHWVQSRVRRVSSRVTDGAHISPDLTSPDYPFVSTVDISGGNIKFDSCLRASAACYEYLVKTGCKPTDGDVLFSKDGTIGRTAVIGADFPDFVVASSLVIISPRPEEMLPKFLDYWLNNQLLKQYVELQLVGAALRRISVEKVAQLPLLIPPLEEQVAIVEILDSLTSRVGILLQHSVEHIARLREYRSSLISAAVTGQLQVGSELKEAA